MRIAEIPFSIYVYLQEFKAKNATAVTLVLATFAEPIYAKKI